MRNTVKMSLRFMAQYHREMCGENKAWKSHLYFILNHLQHKYVDARLNQRNGWGKRWVTAANLLKSTRIRISHYWTRFANVGWGLKKLPQRVWCPSCKWQQINMQPLSVFFDGNDTRYELWDRISSWWWIAGRWASDGWETTKTARTKRLIRDKRLRTIRIYTQTLLYKNIHIHFGEQWIAYILHMQLHFKATAVAHTHTHTHTLSREVSAKIRMRDQL